MTIIAENANSSLGFVSDDSKFCARCNNKKALSDFYKSTLTRDGYESYCKTCKSEYYHERKQKNLLSYKDIAHHKKWWLQENRLKKEAHQKVSYAIKTGELVRQPCERCSSTQNVVAHHEDYNKPLDVVWLCEIHHKERHSELDRMKKDNPKPDMVNSPPHYTGGGIETIAYIRAKLNPEEYVGYLRGNILKYTSRIGLKGAAAEDAGKAEWYSKELHRFLREG